MALLLTWTFAGSLGILAAALVVYKEYDLAVIRWWQDR